MQDGRAQDVGVQDGTTHDQWTEVRGRTFNERKFVDERPMNRNRMKVQHTKIRRRSVVVVAMATLPLAIVQCNNGLVVAAQQWPCYSTAAMAL